MPRLEFMCCVYCNFREEPWYRVYTKRRGDPEVRTSELSIAVCRRLAPLLADRNGIYDHAGMFCGSILTPAVRVARETVPA